MGSKLHPSPQNPDPNPLISSTIEDATLMDSSFLSREEVLRRRSRRIKQLEKYYRDQYWALLEEVSVKHRKYYWSYGVSPMEEEKEEEEEEENKGLGEEEKGESKGFKKRMKSSCAFGGCKSKAMPLTKYCHLHILNDSKQTLYKGCGYVTKRFGSSQTGPIVCGKPILRATVPSLCSKHFQKAQKHLSQALKKAGLNIFSSSRPTAKFNSILLECIRRIQGKRKVGLTKRRKTLNASVENITDKNKNVG